MSLTRDVRREIMKPVITSKGLFEILILTAAFGFALIAYYPFSPGARQSSNMGAAREHATLLTPKLEADPRFADITVGAYTGGGGMLWVVGHVSSEENLRDLKALVIESEPPVETEWSVKVLDWPLEKERNSNERVLTDG